jgi:hypothetical protein
MPKDRTSKLLQNPHQNRRKKNNNNHQKKPDLSIHQTLNKPKKPESGTANQERYKEEDPSTKTQTRIRTPT